MEKRIEKKSHLWGKGRQKTCRHGTLWNVGVQSCNVQCHFRSSHNKAAERGEQWRNTHHKIFKKGGDKTYHWHRHFGWTLNLDVRAWKHANRTAWDLLVRSNPPAIWMLFRHHNNVPIFKRDFFTVCSVVVADSLSPPSIYKLLMGAGDVAGASCAAAWCFHNLRARPAVPRWCVDTREGEKKGKEREKEKRID